MAGHFTLTTKSGVEIVLFGHLWYGLGWKDALEDWQHAAIRGSFAKVVDHSATGGSDEVLQSFQS